MGKADPNCRWCHGTGEIHLVVKTVPCDCTQGCDDCEKSCDGGCDKDGCDCIKLANEDEDEDEGGVGFLGGCYT